MSKVVPFQVPPRAPPVEPELLRSAVFLFGEYLAQLKAATPEPDEDEDEDSDGEDSGEKTPEIETRAVLNLFAEELGTGVAVTLALFLRVTALFRLLAANPALAGMAMDPDGDNTLAEDALLAAARLDLSVRRAGKEGSADFDARAFRQALIRD